MSRSRVAFDVRSRRSVEVKASVTSSAVMAPFAIHSLVVLPEVLHLFPLIGRQLCAQGEEEAGIRLFQFGTGLGHLVNLRHDCRLVWLVGAHQRLHGDLRFFKICAEVYELFAVVLKDAIHRLALILSEFKSLNDLWIVPPATELVV